jgi:hypothetical protein
MPAPRRRAMAVPPTEDTRQLGGDAVLVDGRVVQLWRPRTPNDRPSPGTLSSVREVSLGNGR